MTKSEEEVKNIMEYYSGAYLIKEGVEYKDYPNADAALDALKKKLHRSIEMKFFFKWPLQLRPFTILKPRHTTKTPAQVIKEYIDGKYSPPFFELSFKNPQKFFSKPPNT